MLENKSSMQILKQVFLFLCLGVLVAAFKKPVGDTGTRWYSLNEVSTNLKKQQRPVLIDLYTDWCGWCKVMDKKTYSNKNVSSYLDQKFYAVKVDAEGKNPISWMNRQFKFNESYGTHDFAIYLTGGQLSYPTTVIIPPGGEPQAIPGYLTPKQFEVILKYFGEGAYKTTPFPAFEKNFKNTW